MKESGKNKPEGLYFGILHDNLPGMDMVIIDKDMEIQLALGTEIEKRGWNNSDFPNGNLKQALVPDIFKVIEPILRIALSGTKVSTELSRSGNYFSLQIIPDLKSSADKRNYLIIIQNITDEKVREEQLRLSKNEAEEANRAKSEFIANMSHEIRTPLNAINGFSEQILKTPLNKKQSHFLDIVINASRHLITIINDILLLSRYDAGKIHLEEAPLMIKEVLEEVEKVVEFRYQEKNLKYSYHMDPALDQVFLGDAGKLRQVLINIVSNAIKFTNKGSVNLKAGIIQSGKRVINVKFEVNDTGIGIPEDKLAEIFEPFRQVDSAINRRYSGTGLGLTISRKLVEIMGGKVEVKSKLGKGTLFTIQLPMTLSEVQQGYSREKAPLPKDRKKFRNLKVMLVDDDPVNRLLGEVILKNYGIKAIIASDGASAIRKFRVGRFDLILLDIQMPVVSGLDVARHIRQKEKGKTERARIIAITANVLKKDIDLYLSQGIDDYILKPFNEQVIYNKLHHYYGKQETKASGLKLNGMDPKGESSEKAYDLRDLYRISGNDEEFVKMMLETFIGNATQNLEEMEYRLNRKDFTRIGEIAHKLHPSFQQLGMLKASASLKNLESRLLRENDFSQAAELTAQAIELIKSSVSEIKKLSWE